MLPRRAEESVWGGLSLPQQALETASMSQPQRLPRRWAPHLPAFSGKAEAASAPNHGPATRGLSSGRHPRVRSLTFQVSGFCTALPGSLSSPFLFLFFWSFSFSLFLLQSGSFSRIPPHLDLFKSPVQLVFPPYFRDLEVLINNFEDFEASS